MTLFSIDELKDAAPLERLLAHYGHPLNQDGYAICPFHDDHDPSLYLWDGEDGRRRWWCQACGFGGDQIDLVRRITGRGFNAAWLELARIAPALPDAPARPSAPRDPAAYKESIARAAADAMTRALEPGYDGYLSLYAVGYVARSDGDPGAASRWDRHLRSLGWGVGDRGEVAFPFWTADGELTGVKYRAPDGRRRSEPGSRYPELYLSWLPRTSGRVIVCEGETDCGWASYHSVIGVDVRGLPSGAGSPPGGLPASLSAWDTVYLAFDADEAGRRGRDRWAAALRDAGHRDVRSVPLPEGRDLRSAGATLGAAMAAAVPV